LRQRGGIFEDATGEQSKALTSHQMA